MTPDLSASRIYTDFQGFADLKSAARDKSPEALREVAQQFEAIFIKMMLQSMRDASLADGIFESDQSEMYLGMFDQQLALDLSAKQSFGIADALIRQLGGEALVTPRPQHELNQAQFVESAKQPASVKSAEPLSKLSAEPVFDSPEEFIQVMRPLAVKAAQELGVEPKVLLAQAALETGWGKKIIRHADGSNSHNLFGIKADTRWQGPSALVTTLEYRDAGFKREQASFRSYESYADSFDDYVNFVRDQQRYQNALQRTGDAHQYIYALQDAGYATDPRYAEKIVSIMDRGVI